MKIGALMLFLATASMLAQSPYHPAIPRTWDTEALATLEVPHPDPNYSPVAVSAEYYYGVPVRPVYKTYPVYAPGREPRITSNGCGNKNRKLPSTPHNSIPRRTGPEPGNSYSMRRSVSIS